jgi:membrane protease YdiL (CAAX protease family)
VRWYAAVLAVAVLGPLALGLSVVVGDRTADVDVTVVGALAFFAFSIFPGSALGEEIGWRGFALPHLQARTSALRAALLIGVVWGCWHLPLWLRGAETNPLLLFVPFVVMVIAMSVLCTWIYNGTGGSLLVVVLLHAAANLPLTLLIAPLGEEMTQPFLIFVVLMVLTAAAVVGLTGAEHLSRSHVKQVSVP